MKYFWIIIFSLHFLYSQNLKPKPLYDEQVVNHFAYSLSYNENHEQANWVFYELTINEVLGSFKRKDQFRSDPNIKSGSASLADYKGSGFDRGHLAPAADMKWSAKSMSESFFMSNMSPQTPSFNRGIWKKLESKVRGWAKENESIYIVTGGVLKGFLNTIGKNKVSVPKYYYKVILDYKKPEIKGIGFILPNVKGNKSIDSYKVSIDEVEKFTGIDFFYLLPDSIEEKIESSKDFYKWN
jgi:endonuclease G, mitochondrial